MYGYKSLKEALEKGKTVLFVLKEKHGDGYFIASTIEELHETCLYIIESRTRDDFYIDLTELESPQMPTLTKEQADALPPGNVKNAALEEIVYYEKALESYKADMLAKAEYDRIRATKDGAAAYRFLASRSRYEYEGIDTEIPTRVVT